MWQVVIECAEDTLLNSIYSEYFEGKLKSLVQHVYGNYAVQRLLAAWTDADTVSCGECACVYLDNTCQRLTIGTYKYFVFDTETG